MAGLIFPRDAVVRKQQRREHRLAARQPRSASSQGRFAYCPSMRRACIVAAGLNERERVVVRGADLINQIR